MGKVVKKRGKVVKNSKKIMKFTTFPIFSFLVEKRCIV